MIMRPASCSFLRIAAVAVMLWAMAKPAVAGQAVADSLQASGWDDGIRLPEATDLNPDPGIVEIEMEAQVATVEITPGLEVEAWTYNGLIPGPLARISLVPSTRSWYSCGEEGTDGCVLPGFTDAGTQGQRRRHGVEAGGGEVCGESGVGRPPEAAAARDG